MKRTAREIIDFITDKGLRLRFLDDEILDLEGDAKHEAIAFLGPFSVIDCDERKNRRECIETAIVSFPESDLYIEEVATGECHYSDVMIDGLPYEINYFTVEPVQTVTYENRQAI